MPVSAKLPTKLDRDFARACSLRGAKKSEVLQRAVRLFVQQARRDYPDVFDKAALTPDDETVLEGVEEGNFDLPSLEKYTHFSRERLEKVLASLVERRMLEQREQGGETDRARGARKTLYVFPRRNFAASAAAGASNPN